MPDAPPPGWSQAETAARASYGRLVAHLAWRWRDLAAAEDALSSALLPRSNTGLEPACPMHRTPGS